MLLVLDNMEHLLDAGADVAAIIRECAAVSVIVTSRIPVRIYGEHEFPVPTLTLPSSAEGVTRDEAASSEAVRLFVERAIMARPEFELTDENTPALVDIVTRLDGLPLAIELAATRLRTLSIEALRTRLGARLSLLTGGPRDLPRRQQTLRGAIAWSHELLDAPDRRLFARFSVFAGGALVTQTEAVCGPSEELERDVVDGLELLTEQSLIRTTDRAEPEPRSAMLATIREFATERLDASGEAEAVRRRHAEAFVGLAEEAAGGLTGPEGASWNDRLEAEHDNLRAALDWIVEADEGALGLRMVSALWRFWQVRGHLQEGQQRIDHVLAMGSAPSQAPALLARAEAAAGSISYWRWDSRGMSRHYAAALGHARASGDKALLAKGLYDAGFAPSETAAGLGSRSREGLRYFEESLELYRELDDKAGIASALWGLSGSTLGVGGTRTGREPGPGELGPVARAGRPIRDRVCRAGRRAGHDRHRQAGRSCAAVGRVPRDLRCGR